MEFPRTVIETARLKVAALVAAGAVLVAACTTPDDENNQPAPTTTEAAITYEANPGADELPTTEQAVQSYHGTTTLINNFNVALDVEAEEQKRIDDEGMNKYSNASDVYSLLTNSDPKTGDIRDKMPSRASAPVIDFMINRKGELVYDDKTPSEGVSEEEKKIITAADGAKKVLEPALRNRDVDTLHVRVFKPDTSDIDYEYPDESTAQYVAKDFNDDGKKSVYYFMRAEDYEEAEDMSQIFVHEDAHGMLRQGESNSSNYDPADRESLVKACVTIRDSAKETVAANNSTIIYDLQTLQSMVQDKYKGIYGKIIEALEEGTYDRLPNERDVNAMPECYLQNPWSAFITQALTDKSFNYEKHLAAGVDLGDYETYMQSMIDNYNEIIKENEIYKVLNESFYMKGVDVDKWGHSNEGVDELTTTSISLVMHVPDAFGKHVAELEEEQKQAVASIVERDVQKLMLTHMKDTEYQKFLGDQHALFLTNAGLLK